MENLNKKAFVACNKQHNGMKNELEFNYRQKTDLFQQRLFQMFDLIYAGFISFNCNAILYQNFHNSL